MSSPVERLDSGMNRTAFWLIVFSQLSLAADTFLVEPEEVDLTNIEAFYVLESIYIDASLDEAVKQYGSMENYIREGLGITDEELASLREQLLEPVK